MARIAGVDLPPNKRLWVGLTAIYGIGQQRADVAVGQRLGVARVREETAKVVAVVAR